MRNESSRLPQLQFGVLEGKGDVDKGRWHGLSSPKHSSL